MITVNYGISRSIVWRGHKKRINRNHQGFQLDLKGRQGKKILKSTRDRQILKAIRKRHSGWAVDGFEIVDNLLAACKEQHRAIDTLFALLILKDDKFYPSESGQPWKALIQGKKAIENEEK